jgi:hypothetical protein
MASTYSSQNSTQPTHSPVPKIYDDEENQENENDTASIESEHNRTDLR